jgi:murein L,D-transpeptidase YcbB/YkuD
MTQWGSKYLGDQGYKAVDIIKYFYGDDMYIDTSYIISGVPSSWPGNNLTIGSKGDAVRQIQNQLNAISNKYSAIPKLAVDGDFGQNTANAVKIFQKTFGLPSNGVVDFPTWYKISGIYVAVSRIAELV